MENFASLNWIAIITGTVVSFLAGWLWYSPKLFGQKWADGVGVSLDSADKMPVAAMVTQLIALFLLAVVIGITANVEALITAILVILTAAFFIASAGKFAQKSCAAIAIEFFYIIVSGIIMIICQGIF